MRRNLDLHGVRRRILRSLRQPAHGGPLARQNASRRSARFLKINSREHFISQVQNDCRDVLGLTLTILKQRKLEKPILIFKTVIASQERISDYFRPMV